ncbi:MAG TPA: hypothetical protein VKI19_15010 [Acidimicrobiales bacterium]|nr:hypothetical protein [Acidimicrobiales bacterium]
MSEPAEVTVDVTEAAELGEPCRLAASITLPDASVVGARPVVCFAFPGGGYGRRYYTFDMPGAGGGGQAGWHAGRGWVFVAVDHLGVGDSSQPDPVRLTYENVAAANASAVRSILAGLQDGTLLHGVKIDPEPVALGIGQSMGGCFVIVCQGQHAVFDGIGVLGFSGIHTIVPSRPGAEATPMPWMPRSATTAVPIIVNQEVLKAAGGAAVTGGESLADAAQQAEHPWRWAFHYDDEPSDVVDTDMAAGLSSEPLPPWRSATTPPCAIQMVAPGTVATEAAAIRVPVFIGVGERDVVPDPYVEPKAFFSSSEITLSITERMAHMHNFAQTREKLWSRLHHWGEGVAAGH